ncbi:VWA domain-containing protein [Cupriavidus necator]|uniref:nitric oxide reductase activation protein NorD n=1 Tax=Cupriavidus necator TaxID=106590 RepID=UPI0039C2579C
MNVNAIPPELATPHETGSSVRPAFSALTLALSGRSMQLQAHTTDVPDAAPLRPILTSTHLLLPTDHLAADAAEPARLYRASIAHAAAHLRYSPASQPTGTLKPMSLAVMAALEDARVEHLLANEFPGTRAWCLPLLAQSLEPHGLSFTALISRLNYALMTPDYSDDNYWVNKARTMFDALRGSLEDYAAFRALGSILANDLGQMRVRFDPQQYVVPPAYRDDNTYLWQYPDAPPEPAKGLDIAGSGDVEARQADARHDGPQDDAHTLELVRATYPELDYRSGVLRSHWATVIEQAPPAVSRTALSALGSLPRLNLPARNNLTRDARRRRQPEGDDLDLDAVIEHAIDRRRGHTPGPRVFISPGSRRRPLRILLLLDASASTNRHYGTAAQSILDREKDAALMLARAAASAGDIIAVHGFCSDTRHGVNYYRLLDFDSPLDSTAQAAIQAMPGRCSTRMGAALRHAAMLLRIEGRQDIDERRVIVVITDGAPADIDVADDCYLVEDARAAAAEARRAGIVAAGIVVEACDAGYMRRIFGPNAWRVAGDASALPARLAALYARLAAD